MFNPRAKLDGTLWGRIIALKSNNLEQQNAMNQSELWKCHRCQFGTEKPNDEGQQVSPVFSVQLNHSDTVCEVSMCSLNTELGLLSLSHQWYCPP
jgi:hypothetical protein